MVQSGKKIIDTGEIVTDDIYQELISLRHAIEDKNISQRQSLLSIVGSGICIALLIMVFYFYLYTYRRKLLDNLRHILFFVILMAIITTAAFLTLQHAPVGYIYMIPLLI